MKPSIRRFLRVRAGYIAGILCIQLTGCAAQHGYMGTNDLELLFDRRPPPLALNFALKAIDVESLIRTEFEHWQGTDYVFGGTTTNGVDCSAFVNQVFYKIFDINLPRTALEQSRQGTSIEWDDLQAGDLVFFKGNEYPYHVGIYLSHGEFAHASSTLGVAVSSLDSRYWKRAFWQARRLAVS